MKSIRQDRLYCSGLTQMKSIKVNVSITGKEDMN